MKVIKFGGGCLKNGEYLLKVKEILWAEKDKTVVVTSALFGITDLLEEGIKAALESDKNVSPFLKEFQEKHENIAFEAITDQLTRNVIRDKISEKILKLERLLYGVSYISEVSPSLKVHILSYGERLAALILSAVVNTGERIKSIPLEADEIGIITDESFENATAHLPEVKKNLLQTVLPLIGQGTIPVITGYFGKSGSGKITTFGRNGSDYSAAVIANVLNANILEIWKDVDGFMTADPKLVPEARKIEHLSYYEAAELSYFGAKILYPRTVEPLLEKEVPITINNLFKPDVEGTRIGPRSRMRKNIIKSITYNEKIAVLRIHGPGVGFKPGIIAEIGNSLSTEGINIYSVITSQTCINLLIDKKDAQKSYKTLKRSTGGIIEKIVLESNISLIAVVGLGLLKGRGVAAKVFSAVAGINVNIEMISSGASDVASYFIVQGADLEKAVKAVHKEFF